MKKSNIIFLLVMQIVLIFIFSNIYTLFKPLEEKEKTGIIEKADIQAELLVLKYGGDIDKMLDSRYFNHISLGEDAVAHSSTKLIDNTFVYSIHIPLEDGQSVVFVKEITSITLELLAKLNKTFFNLSLIISIFIILTGFYFIYHFKRSKLASGGKDMPPLQEYLLELKGAEQQLKNIVKEQQESVNLQDELSKSIINNINAAVILINTNNRIDIFNPVASKIFSQSFSNAKNNTLNRILLDHPAIIEFVDQDKTGIISRELQSGERFFAIDLIPLEKIGKLIIIKDITDEKKRESISLRNKNFIMLGEMTAYLAHEVRNSLGVIYGYTKTMKTGGKNENNLEEKVNRVNTEIQFLSSMMETFLNFSKPIRVEKKEKIDFNRLLSEIALEKEVSLKLEGESVEIVNDRPLIHSVFSNLFLNSREAGAQDITVSIEKDQQLDIYFKDNGKGIDEKNREKVWLPFFTTKDKGTGMGLAIIRKIINSLQGEISLVRTVSGTTFKITFYD